MAEGCLQSLRRALLLRQMLSFRLHRQTPSFRLALAFFLGEALSFRLAHPFFLREAQALFLRQTLTFRLAKLLFRRQTLTFRLAQPFFLGEAPPLFLRQAFSFHFKQPFRLTQPLFLRQTLTFRLALAFRYGRADALRYLGHRPGAVRLLQRLQRRTRLRQLPLPEQPIDPGYRPLQPGFPRLAFALRLTRRIHRRAQVGQRSEER